MEVDVVVVVAVEVEGGFVGGAKRGWSGEERRRRLGEKGRAVVLLLVVVGEWFRSSIEWWICSDGSVVRSMSPWSLGWSSCSLSEEGASSTSSRTRGGRRAWARFVRGGDGALAAC